jgi:hypothetical protein
LEIVKPLIRRIYQECNQDGLVPWRQVFKKHPEWEKELAFKKNPQRIYSLINNMRKSSELTALVATVGAPVELPSRPAAAAPVAGAAPQADQVLERILREYRDDEKVNFKVAWLDHPEWKTMLGAEGAEGMRMLYWKARQMAEKLGLVPVKARTYKGRKSKAAAAETNGAAEQRYTDGLQFCPHCGEPIAAWNRAYNASKKRA